MGSKVKSYRLYLLVFGYLSALAAKRENNSNIQNIDREPVIEPDYSGVTIPTNIAPMNFLIKEDGEKIQNYSNYPVKTGSYRHKNHRME